MKTLLGMVVVVVLPFYFMGYIEVPCSICILSFVATFNIKWKYYKYSISSEQAEHYNGYNTILNMFFGFIIGVYWLNLKSYPFDKTGLYFKLFGDNAYWVESGIFIVILIMIAVNISQGIHLPQHITDMEADYKRRLYNQQIEENEQ